MTAPAKQAYALLRLAIGVDMLMHGLTRIGSGVEKFVSKTAGEFQGTILPEPLVHGFATVLPYFEALIGALLVLGLFTRGALVAGGLLMIVLIFGTSLRSEWNTVGLQLGYAFLYYLLLANVERNAFALDRQPQVKA